MPPANHRKASNGYLLIKIEELGAEILLPNCKIRLLNYVNTTEKGKKCELCELNSLQKVASMSLHAKKLLA